ncbi:hypothetical protein BO86DRAFT_347951 [Aspergillus japonicus CBS 114.51]|uniref:Zn(2)-C6 fungal-type domain-containing protein n=1 Tax=Aspergillus japonicus CBS 114.51 TaxID=1448312 RepID=A0A8T8WNA2_ASPJA|nr:hypothetical protein BO86DRAFT_347951 [Aspergillus japonicus CBS 114.51]RAH77164.1 hypothetical protein BO86DRAFT_347951 [Aspergillus japonicus CBS 114.51]
MPPKITKRSRVFQSDRFRLLRSPSVDPASFNSHNRSNSHPACDRCRGMKKRCDRSRPDCASCIHAGRKCSYPGGRDEVEALQARLDKLTEHVRELEAVRTPQVGLAQRLIEPHGPVASPIVLVEAFLHHVYRAYPFLDKERILRAAVDVPNDSPEDDAMILYMVMAIGHTSLERSGKAPSAETAGFTIAYAEILQRCTMEESIYSVQILILLALYSLFDPQGPSTWTIVGIITRQAVSLGLTRPGLLEDGLTPQTVQLRRRLFWSIFVLDRMMAVSVGQSPGLTVEDAMIPLPTITVEEFATPERAEVAAMLQVSRHVIELRQLEARILSTVHLTGGCLPGEKAPFDCSTITAKLRLDIEDWYSQGCLISRPEPDNVRVHDTMGWLNARYYHLLLLLHYPCRFNVRSDVNGIFRVRSLLELVRKFLQYNRVLLSSRQLPLNRITLNRLVPACLVLLHCFASDADLADPIRIETRVCIDILGSFPPQWRQAHHLVGIMRKLEEILPGPAIGVGDDSVQSSRLEMLSLLGDTLGRANCYQDIVSWEEPTGLSFARMEGQSPKFAPPLSRLNEPDVVCSFF